MSKILQALRAKKTVHVVAAVNATMAVAVAFGAPITAEQMAGVNVLVSAWLIVLVGPPTPGADGDPETPQ